VPVARRWRKLLQSGVAAGALALAGCGQDVPQQSVATQGVLCSNDFQACVMPVLSGQIRREDGATVSCMNSSCHLVGGNGGRFTLSATDVSADMQVVQALSNLDDPHSSPVLIKPSEEVTHGGGHVFQGRSDGCYLAIFNWISTKADPVLGDASPVCGKCVAIADTSTSCGFP
jgi:hypothetical protein